MTYGCCLRRRWIHSPPGSLAPSRHSQWRGNRTPTTPARTECATKNTSHWCTDVESNDVVRLFRPAQPPGLLSVHDAYEDRTRLADLKGQLPHQVHTRRSDPGRS